MVKFESSEERNHWLRSEYTQKAAQDAKEECERLFRRLVGISKGSSDSEAAKAAVHYEDAVKMLAFLEER